MEIKAREKEKNLSGSGKTAEGKCFWPEMPDINLSSITNTEYGS